MQAAIVLMPSQCQLQRRHQRKPGAPSVGRPTPKCLTGDGMIKTTRSGNALSVVTLGKCPMSSKNWFDVSTAGLRQLQEGKPKHYILRELIQNCWDEPINRCTITTAWGQGRAEIEVRDDSPEGFKDITHAFTLFAPTYKRAEPEKRGRFNAGEKQLLALCDWASIKTTKGTVIFSKDGRRQSRSKTYGGSIITLHVKMLKSEYDDMLEVVKSYITPMHIILIVNGESIPNRFPLQFFEATLPTEFEEDGVFRRTQRKTKIHLHLPQGKAWLYEMGIPVQELECKYSVDVQQKVPLSIDRDSVPQSFLTVLYAEVLNATHQDLKPEESSEAWIHEASESKRIIPEAIKTVIEKRYGSKVVVATPTDRNSIDEALSRGFKVVHGSELSGAEWENVRKAEAIPSSSQLFGSSTAAGEPVEPTIMMLSFRNLAERIAKQCLGIEIQVRFMKWDGVAAQYGNKTLTMNVKALGADWFIKAPLSKRIALILHELAHENGSHTEHSYHETLTNLGGELVELALRNPKFFPEVA